VIENALDTQKLDDIKVINVMMRMHEHGLMELQRTDWFRNGRAHPFIFMQLADDERRAMAQIATLQGGLAAVFGDKYVLLQERARRSEIEPRKLLEVQKEDLEIIVNIMRHTLTTGFDKKLLRDTCPDENKDKPYMQLILDEKTETAGGDNQKKEKKQEQAVKLQ
jgi:hypothetical protein